MKFDYSAVTKFQEYVNGEIDMDELMEHPAYRAIQNHAENFGSGISSEDVEKALEGEKTPFYGTEMFEENRVQIATLIKLLEDNQERWIDIITIELDRVFPREDKYDLVIYPVIGYDTGIGIDNCICMNVNSNFYLSFSREFLYMAIHESTHALYERVHGFPKLSELSSTSSMISFFNTLLHTEGYAVYTPLKRRKKDGSIGNTSHPIQEDYLVLEDHERLKRHISIYDSFRKKLQNNEDLTTEEFLDNAFGKDRYTYREGGAIIEEIEKTEGIEGVWDAFYADPDKFAEKYDRMLDKYR